MSRSGPAVLLDDYTAGPRVVEFEAAPPAPGELLVEVESATVCGTDVHISRGAFAHLARLPLVMGHEGCGRIAEIGAGASADSAGARLEPGDRIVWAHNWCGACYYCAVARQPTLCENTMGYGWGPYHGRLNGTFSRHLHVAAESRVLRVPDGISSELASSSTCALRTVMHALDRLPPIRFGHTVAVLGAGPVGLYAAAASAASGAYQTILIGAPANRLAIAESWGLAAIINIERTAAAERVEAVRSLTSGRGADLVLECAGPPSAFTEGIEMLRKGGTLMVIGQAHGERVPVDTTGLKVRQITVASTLSADVSHFRDALAFLERHSGRFGLEGAITSRTYSLEQIDEALDAMAAGREIKPVIDPQHSP